MKTKDFDDIFNGIGVLIELPVPDDFLKVAETLTRIGIASRRENKLYQSCHILHKRGQYVILHFKELFKLDGKETNIDENDYIRRNKIAFMLEEWGLVNIINPEEIEADLTSVVQIKILSHHEKKNWILEAKYNIGNKKRY